MSGSEERRGSELRSREFDAGDVHAAMAIFESNVPDYFTAGERSEYEAFLGELPGPYLVVEDGAGEVVACGGYAVVLDDGRGDLCWGMVRRDLHGRGIGRFLTVVRVEALRADPRVRSVVLNTSHLTQEFYERLGFETVGRVEDGFAPGLHRCDMRLSIERP